MIECHETMETENTKTINNEHVGKIQRDETPLLDGEIRVVPSPVRVHETDAYRKGDSLNPSTEDNLSPAFHEQSSQMQSPPIQMMAPTTPPGYDPTRIPTSIFSTKPTNPAEWSVTSNESLFSIHMGNNSFSRDYAILFGKSGDVQDWNGSELPRLDERTNNNSNNIPKSCELIGLPTVMEGKENTIQNVEPGVKVENHEREVEVVGRSPDVTRKAMPAETTSLTTSSSPPLEKHEKEKVFHDEVVNSPTDDKKCMAGERLVPNHPPTIPSPPRFSDDSGNSGNSFAFPVLVGEGGKGAESLKVVPEQPEQPELQGRDSKETPNAPGTTRWFSFLVCWPRCC